MYSGGGFFGSILLLALGFIVLHFANKDKSQYLKIAGYILAAAGALSLVYVAYMRFSGSCTPYGHHGRMHSSYMRHGMMGPGMMMEPASECIKLVNGKTMNAENMKIFHDCMSKNKGMMNSPPCMIK